VNWRAIARNDARKGIQSPVVWGITVAFFLLTLIIGRFVSRESLLTGAALAETNANTTLLVLVFLFVPVAGLAISVPSIVRARQRETVDLSTDDSSRELLAGTFAGRAGVLAAAVFVGFLPAFLLLILQSETVPVFAVFNFFVSALLLGLLFVAFGLAISSFARSRRQAIAGGVVAFLLLYAWPFLPSIVGLGVPQSVLERFWLVFVFGDVVEALFSIRQGELTGSLFGLVVLALFIVLPLAASYAGLERLTEGKTSTEGADG